MVKVKRKIGLIMKVHARYSIKYKKFLHSWGRNQVFPFRRVKLKIPGMLLPVVNEMDGLSKIEAIVSFVTRHPQSTASRRICREVMGRGAERLSEEFATELATGLREKDETSINSYYSLIR